MSKWWNPRGNARLSACKNGNNHRRTLIQEGKTLLIREITRRKKIERISRKEIQQDEESRKEEEILPYTEKKTALEKKKNRPGPGALHHLTVESERGGGDQKRCSLLSNVCPRKRKERKEREK